MNTEKPVININVLGISGSPVEGGNCDKLVKECLKSAAELGNVETDFVSLANKKITMCEHCQYCIENKTDCKIQDDVPGIFELITKADGLILGGPTWTFTLAPPLLNLFSRSRNIVFNTNAFRNKVVGMVTLSWFGFGMEQALASIESITKPLMMIPVAQSTSIVSSAAFGQKATYLKNGVLDDKKGIFFAKNVAVRVVEVSRMIKFATQAGVTLDPEHKRNISGGKVKV